MQNRIPLYGKYQVPEVIRDGRGPFNLAQNPSDLEFFNPVDPSQTLAPAEYSWHTAVRSRSPINDKNVSELTIRELIGIAEKVFASAGKVFTSVALISGMPVLLKTNSPHVANFWTRNWYLGCEQEVEQRFGRFPITLRAVMGANDPSGKPFKIGAYYCPKNREIVFINTDYYGQNKSWALGAAGVGLADFGIHSIHGACVEIDGVGVLIIAPTGTGKSTYTNELAKYGFINSDDWVYVVEENGEFYAIPSERYIYVRSNAVEDDPAKGHTQDKVLENPVMRRQFEIFEQSPAENVPVVNGRRIYEAVANSRVLINPLLLSPMSFKTPIKVVFLLRRDNENPYCLELTPDEAVSTLARGEYTISPGVTDDTAKWGTLACESWYNPYLLEPNNDFEASRFRALGVSGKAQYVIINTAAKFAQKRNPDGSPDLHNLIHATTRDMLHYVSRYSGKNYLSEYF